MSCETWEGVMCQVSIRPLLGGLETPKVWVLCAHGLRGGTRLQPDWTLCQVSVTGEKELCVKMVFSVPGRGWSHAQCLA